MNKTFSIFIISLLLMGCTSEKVAVTPTSTQPTIEPSRTPSPSMTSTVTPSATFTATPTLTPTPTNTPTPTLAFPLGTGTPLPVNLPEISTENVLQIRELASWDAGFAAKDFPASSSISPDGKLLAIGMESGLIQLWDIDSRNLLYTIKAHKSYVTGLEFLPDGKTLISGSNDQTVKYWQISDGTQSRSVNIAGRISSMALSQDGQYLALGGYIGILSGFVRLMNVEDSKTISKINTRGYVTGLSFSSDGSKLAVAAPNRDMGVWSVPDLSSIKIFYGKSGYTAPFSVSFSPDDKLLVSGAVDHTGFMQTTDYMLIFDAEDGTLLDRVNDVNGSVEIIDFIPGTDLFLTEAAQGGELSTKIHIYNTQGALLEKLEPPPMASISENLMGGMSVSRDGKLVITITRGGRITLWGITP